MLQLFELLHYFDNVLCLRATDALLKDLHIKNEKLQDPESIKWTVSRNHMLSVSFNVKLNGESVFNAKYLHLRPFNAKCKISTF